MTTIIDYNVVATERSILDHISGLPHGRAGFKQLVREMGARGAAREDLEAALERLVQHGDLVELRSGHYLVTRLSREYAAGRLSAHRDGYAFLIADSPLAGVHGDLFIPPDSAAQAMHGDRVLARIGRISGDGRAEGQIVRILRRAHPTVVGQFRALSTGNYVEPHDDRIRQRIRIPKDMETPARDESRDRIGAAPATRVADGVIVNVEILEFPRPDREGVGRVVEVLGHPDDFGVDVEITIRKHHLPHRFPPEAIAAAEGIPHVIRAEELDGREDFRGFDVVTIDGETARDFDDAVWVDRSGGGFLLHVHIADVSHYVLPGSPIDREARLRGTSVYFPDRAVPMLPLDLSTGICSLKPGVDRLTLSALLDIDHNGDVVKQRFCRGVIHSVERMTYTAVHLALEGDPGMRERYSRLTARFEIMRELALILQRKRERRGSIDFSLPEPQIEFDPEGRMTGVSRAPRNVAHRIIEEFMLSANEAVAAHLTSADVGLLYRIHETPDPGRVIEFDETASRFGYSLTGGAAPVKRFAIVDRKRDGRKIRRDVVRADERFTVSSRHYQKLVAKIEGKPEERILSYLMLRSLKQARYSADHIGHFALAAPTYTHFTSPIRRYPDLIVHRALSSLLDHRPAFDSAELEALAQETSESERRAADAERDLVEWKKVQFMMDRVGDRFPALIISVTKFGVFIELEELFIEGLVPLDTLPGERWNYHENARKIIGERSHRELTIGDPVDVVLDRVDGVEKKLYFSLFEPEPRRRRTVPPRAPRTR